MVVSTDVKIMFPTCTPPAVSGLQLEDEHWFTETTTTTGAQKREQSSNKLVLLIVPTTTTDGQLGKLDKGLRTVSTISPVNTSIGDSFTARKHFTCEDEPCLPRNHLRLQQAKCKFVTRHIANACRRQRVPVLACHRQAQQRCMKSRHNGKRGQKRELSAIPSAKKPHTHGVRVGRRMICRKILPCNCDDILGKEMISWTRGSQIGDCKVMSSETDTVRVSAPQTFFAGTSSNCRSVLVSISRIAMRILDVQLEMSLGHQFQSATIIFLVAKSCLIVALQQIHSPLPTFLLASCTDSPTCCQWVC